MPAFVTCLNLPFAWKHGGRRRSGFKDAWQQGTNFVSNPRWWAAFCLVVRRCARSLQVYRWSSYRATAGLQSAPNWLGAHHVHLPLR